MDIPGSADIAFIGGSVMGASSAYPLAAAGHKNIVLLEKVDFFCAGFSGHGFMHAPISGKLISEIILNGETRTVNMSSLDLTRFDEDRLMQEYTVV